MSMRPRPSSLVEQGRTVVIARHGNPVAELIPVQRSAGFPFGIARNSPLVPEGNEWWAPMSDEEADAWADGC